MRQAEPMLFGVKLCRSHLPPQNLSLGMARYENQTIWLPRVKFKHFHTKITTETFRTKCMEGSICFYLKTEKLIILTAA